MVTIWLRRLNKFQTNRFSIEISNPNISDVRTDNVSIRVGIKTCSVFWGFFFKDFLTFKKQELYYRILCLFRYGWIGDRRLGVGVGGGVGLRFQSSVDKSPPHLLQRLFL